MDKFLKPDFYRYNAFNDVGIKHPPNLMPLALFNIG